MGAGRKEAGGRKAGEWDMGAAGMANTASLRQREVANFSEWKCEESLKTRAEVCFGKWFSRGGSNHLLQRSRAR